METKEINWNKVSAGTFFKCKIQSNFTFGRIQFDTDLDIFLCQNIADGTRLLSKFGYDHSWCIGKGLNLESYDVTELELSEEPFEGMVVLPMPNYLTIGSNYIADIRADKLIVDDEIYTYDQVKSIIGELVKHNLYYKTVLKTLDKEISPKIKWKEIEVGTWFGALFRDKFCIGKIQKEDGHIFLCQDIADGRKATDKLGFKYSWSISDGTFDLLDLYDVRNLTIFDEKPEIPKLIDGDSDLLNDFCDYSVYFNNGKIDIGCQTFTVTMGRKVLAAMNKLRKIEPKKVE